MRSFVEMDLDQAAGAFTLYCRSKGLAERTLETYSYALQRLRKHLSANGASPPIPSPQGLRGFVTEMLGQGMARGTIRIRMRAIRCFCNFMEREGIVETSPMKGVESPDPAP